MGSCEESNAMVSIKLRKIRSVKVLMQIPNIVQCHPNDISSALQDCSLLRSFRLSA